MEQQPKQPEKKTPKAFFFNKETDALLKHYVAEYADKPKIDWKEIGRRMNLRTRQVKERYMMYLDKPRNFEPLTNQEYVKLLLLHQEYGNKWSKIADAFQNRAPITLKNAFKRLTRRGVNYQNMTALLSSQNSLLINYSVKRQENAKEKKEKKEKMYQEQLRAQLTNNSRSQEFFTFEGYMNIMGREVNIWNPAVKKEEESNSKSKEGIPPPMSAIVPPSK